MRERSYIWRVHIQKKLAHLRMSTSFCLNARIGHQESGNMSRRQQKLVKERCSLLEIWEPHSITLTTARSFLINFLTLISLLYQFVLSYLSYLSQHIHETRYDIAWFTCMFWDEGHVWRTHSEIIATKLVLMEALYFLNCYNLTADWLLREREIHIEIHRRNGSRR